MFVTQCLRVPRRTSISCPLLRSYFIGSCSVGISKRLSPSISLAVYCSGLELLEVVCVFKVDCLPGTGFTIASQRRRREFVWRQNFGASPCALLTFLPTYSPHKSLIYWETEDITRWREDINFMFEWQEQYLTSECSEQVGYCSCHENIKFIPSS